MNTPATFEDTVGILVRAYSNDTLIHLDCAACAVGNILAAKNNRRYLAKNKWVDTAGQVCPTQWYNAVRHLRFPDGIELKPGSLDEIAQTGYSLEEVDRIERAFEVGGLVGCDPVLAGLLAVVDVLADIHGIDLTTATAAKALFVKPADALAAA